MGYISKIAKDWGEHEINTLDAADERLRELRSDESSGKNLLPCSQLIPEVYRDKVFIS